MIEIINATKIFKNKNQQLTACKNINLTIQTGDIFGVLGASGAGKSTLLRCINLLERASGKIIIDGEDVLNYNNRSVMNLRRQIGMVFQNFCLLEQKTVAQNIAFALKINKFPKDKIDNRVTELLSFVELLDKKNSYISKLSGGQKQRVAIARAIANNTKILLCDEMTSALDSKSTYNILSLLKKINAELNVTIIMISHETNVIKDICKNVAIMSDGEIVEVNSNYEIFNNPQNEITKEILFYGGLK